MSQPRAPWASCPLRRSVARRPAVAHGEPVPRSLSSPGVRGSGPRPVPGRPRCTACGCPRRVPSVWATGVLQPVVGHPGALPRRSCGGRKAVEAGVLERTPVADLGVLGRRAVQESAHPVRELVGPRDAGQAVCGVAGEAGLVVAGEGQRQCPGEAFGLEYGEVAPLAAEGLMSPAASPASQRRPAPGLSRTSERRSTTVFSRTGPSWSGPNSAVPRRSGAGSRARSRSGPRSSRRDRCRADTGGGSG